MLMIKNSRLVRMLAAMFAIALIAAACGSSSETATGGEFADSPCYDDPGLTPVEAADDPSSLDGTSITLATHDSFFLSEGTLEAFTAETGITVEQVAVGAVSYTHLTLPTKRIG